MQRSHAHGHAILTSATMHIMDFWVRVIPHPSNAAILNSGVRRELNLRPTWKNGIMHMISIFQKISNSGAMVAHAPHLLRTARLNRYPRITDAESQNV